MNIFYHTKLSSLKVAYRRPASASRRAATAKAQSPPIPAFARRLLPSVERRVVDVTRGDEPVYTRPTVAEDAEPVSETTAQIRARLEGEEDEREQARGQGELGELPTLGADRPSEGQTQVFSAAAARLAAQAPQLPTAADDGEDLDERTQVRSREPGAASAPVFRVL